MQTDYLNGSVIKGDIDNGTGNPKLNKVERGAWFNLVISK